MDRKNNMPKPNWNQLESFAPIPETPGLKALAEAMGRTVKSPEFADAKTGSVRPENQAATIGSQAAKPTAVKSLITGMEPSPRNDLATRPTGHQLRPNEAAPVKPPEPKLQPENLLHKIPTPSAIEELSNRKPRPQAEKKALVAIEPAAGENHAHAQISPAPPGTPSVEPAQAQPQHTAPAVNTVQYQQQVDEPPEQERVDELLEQVLAVDARAEVQAQAQAQMLEPPGAADFDPNVLATPGLELPQQYQPTALQDDLPQQ